MAASIRERAVAFRMAASEHVEELLEVGRWQLELGK
jgi:hypothetical protein